jgi:predicted cupin superfamily sugar epimerase
MERYKNLRGNSPVLYFLVEEDSISVWFKGNSKTYIYPEYLTGKHHLIQP